jgi:cyclopropane fatty-acyl-phospholipid synthase-like methyltransferase
VSSWDTLFDDIYPRTYAQLADPEAASRDAEGLVRLVGLEPGADVLDCPCG